MTSVHVCIITEGTYPITLGGVGLWVHTLIKNMPDIEFTVVALVPKEKTTPVLEIPKNVKKIIYVPFPMPEKALKVVPESEIPDEIPMHLIEFHKNISKHKIIKAGKYLKELYSFFSEHPIKLWSHKLVWQFLEKVYSVNKVEEPFFQWLVHWKNAHAPLLTILSTKIPKADLYHATNAGYAGLVATLAKLIYSKPAMITDHGIYIREIRSRVSQSSMSPVEKRFWIKTSVSINILNYMLVDKITTVCKYNKKWVIENVGVPADKIEVIYNGVDINYFRPLLIPRDPNLVGTVARVYGLKDIKNFIKAAKHVVNRVPDAKFVVVGSIADPSYWEECNRLVHLLKLEDKFQFVGRSTNPVFWYNSLSLFVLSSASEGFPLSTIEAMACGTPAIVTNVGGAGEAVGSCGFVVEPYNPKALGEKITWCLTHNEELEKLRQCARERAVKMFSLEKVVQKFKRVYINLVS